MLRAINNYWILLPGNVKGALFMLLATFFGSIMSALIKHVGQRIPVFEILFIRQICVLLIISPIIVQTLDTVFKTTAFRLHLMRSFFAAIAMATGFTALVHLPLAEVTAIGFARTLFTTLLAILFLRETVGMRRWSVTIIGFIGVLIIIRPSPNNLNEYAFLALLSSLFVASIVIVLRRLSQIEPAPTIMVYQSLFVTLVMAGPAFYFWINPTWPELVLIMLIGTLMSAMQWLTIQALKFAEAVAVAPIDYFRLLFATALGMLFFSETPTVWTIIGSSVIIASTLYTIRRNAHLKRQNDAA
ncbi:MAG: hypothetical protein CMF69_05940 [Magnetovibrio sp.]|nr:hypothetical protein [Magnetovibrio sp.]|tara:strand:+ start:449 stop:1351 length:903 start_codon:yes stop_codon:yes gene_type:complete